MKLFFVLALLCASVCSFSQDTRVVEVCGGMYLKEWAKRCATEAAVINYFENPDEAYVSTTYMWYAGIGWCYTNTYQCVLPPLNKEKPVHVKKIEQPLDN